MRAAAAQSTPDDAAMRECAQCAMLIDVARACAHDMITPRHAIRERGKEVWCAE